MTPHQRKVMWDIEHRGTGNLGYHIDVCDNPDCRAIETHPNSCCGGCCPRCQSNRRQAWVEARLDDMLPVPYFHCVFTLPNDFFPMCLFNKKTIYEMLFQSAAETLKKFGKDQKWLDAKIGFFGILHNWGQLLNTHLHIHFIVPAGGVDGDGNWVHPKCAKNNFLFPVTALSIVFRGIFIEKLRTAREKGKFSYPGELSFLEDGFNFENWIRKLVPKDWLIFAKKPFDRIEREDAYIGRYTTELPLRISEFFPSITESSGFPLEITRKSSRSKNTRRSGKKPNFRPWSSSAVSSGIYPPKRCHRIRYFGFLGNGCKKQFRALRERLFRESNINLSKKQKNPKKSEHAAYLKKEACKRF